MEYDVKRPGVKILMAEKIKDDINAAAKAANPSRYSWRLKPSDLGSDCTAALWYAWRWARKQDYDGRMARLFKRGHKAEAGLVEYLRLAGWTIWEVDPATGKQWRGVEFDKHMSYYLDAYGSHPEYSNGFAVPIEFKTYNEKRFNAVVSKTVHVSDPKYFVQVAIYNELRQTPWCLFVAVNKNNDDIYIEIIERHTGHYNDAMQRAHTIKTSKVRPARLAQNPTHHVCKTCTYIGPCHHAQPVDVNCRSCLNVEAVKDGKFRCNLWNLDIPGEAEIMAACSSHDPIQ